MLGDDYQKYGERVGRWLLAARALHGTWGPVHQSRVLAVLIPLLLVAGCKRENDRTVFKLLSPEQTGITFANTITTNDTFNIQTDVYVYNGAGVRGRCHR